MFTYHLRLALLSLKRNPMLTALMIGAIAVGIGALMTVVTGYYTRSSNPIFWKNDQLYHVQFDAYRMSPEFEEGEEPADQINWMDANNLLDANRADRQVIMFKTGFPVSKPGSDFKPELMIARATYNDMFPMFDMPFLYGGPWSDEDDERAGYVTVLSRETNDKIFGGEDSIGEEVVLGENTFRVVGVLDNWEPMPKFYDLTNGSFNESEELYVPFTLVDPLQLPTYGNTNCSRGDNPTDFDSFKQSTCNWITMWVELDGAAAADNYREFMSAYVAEQKQLGRHERPENNRLRTPSEWLEAENVAGDDTRVLVGLAVLFLVVCLLNTVGLLLAKFVGRAPQVGLRRAVGASKWDLFRQHLVEVGIIGFIGGLVGLGLAMLGLLGVQALFDSPDALVAMNWELALSAVGVAIFVSLLAGLYPTWRMCQLPPGRHLKTQ